MNKKLLLHICCAPDEAWVLSILKEQYELHSFFCNPNIYPPEEYDNRLKEAEWVAKKYNVPFTADDYDPEDWENAIKGYEDTPEGGARCFQCFLLRLKRSAEFCSSIGFESFTTVMSISPHKKIDMLNKAGEMAAMEYEVIYKKFNFKKNNGFINSVKLSKELGLTRQDYCGCRLSLKERNERKKDKKSLNI
jgi:predicted adenine nucleotide alpha hydrolase (AANH) superfamily ATPase